MKARLLLIHILLLITACGFHLRGSQTTKINVDNIFINDNSALAEEVKSQFKNAGASFAASPQSASKALYDSSGVVTHTNSTFSN